MLNDSKWEIFKKTLHKFEYKEKCDILRNSIKLFIILHEFSNLDINENFFKLPKENVLNEEKLNTYFLNCLEKLELQAKDFRFLLSKNQTNQGKSIPFLNNINFMKKNHKNYLFLAEFYEDFIMFKHQKGTYYTPKWLCDYLLQKTKVFANEEDTLKKKTVLNIGDISSGAGIFIQSIPLYFKSPIITAIDIDPVAIEISKINFHIFYSNQVETIYKSHISLFSMDSLSASIPNSPFDILCGNPPWGIPINSYESMLNKKFAPLFNFAEIKAINSSKIENTKIYSKVNHSYKIRDQIDIYALFIFENFLNLTDGGILSLILPSTLLFNPVYLNLRKYLLLNSEILHISYLGENIFPNVNVPSLILILKKSTPSNEHRIQISLLGKNQEIETKYQIPQINFIKNPFFNFTIFSDEQNDQWVNKILSTPHQVFGDFVKNTRGVELGKKGSIYECPMCKKWNPTPKFKSMNENNSELCSKCNLCKSTIFEAQIKNVKSIILPNAKLTQEEINKDGWVPLIRGQDLEKYCLTSSHHLKLNYLGIKYKNSQIYNSPKILLRKTGKGIIGTIDYHNHYTLQVVYIFLKKYNITYSLEYLFAIISSKLMEYYYQQKYTNPNKKTFPHIIQANILTLPIPIIDLTDIKSQEYQLYVEINTIIKELFQKINHNNKHSLEVTQLIQQKDELVNLLFNLPKNFLREK